MEQLINNIFTQIRLFLRIIDKHNIYQHACVIYINIKKHLKR